MFVLQRFPTFASDNQHLLYYCIVFFFSLWNEESSMKCLSSYKIFNFVLILSRAFTALEWLWYQTVNCKIALASKQNRTVLACDPVYYLSKEACALKWMCKGCIVYNALPICSAWQQDVSIHLVLTDWGGWLSSGLESSYGWAVKTLPVCKRDA